VSDQPADELDLGRDAIHNFKVAFGFRALGQDVDGGVDNGPYWEVLTTFAEDTSYYIANDAGTLVCGPMSAEVADDNALDRARRRIDAIIMRANPAVVNGDPRSLTKTKGDVGLSRWSRRSARSSSPWIGWVLCVPFLTRRTWGTAPLKSTWSHLRDSLKAGKSAVSQTAAPRRSSTRAR
jgi:hypothetical protein